MAKKTAQLALILILAFNLGTFFAHADENALRLRAEFNSIRYEMEETENAYKEDMDKVKKENEAEVTALKKEFHTARNGYIAKRKAKEKKLKKDYKKRMKILVEKEEEIIARLEPKESNNFARIR